MADPKYKIGDSVKVIHKTMPHWSGIVYHRAEVDEGVYEYWVTNAPCVPGGLPCLVWESEITPLKTKRQPK